METINFSNDELFILAAEIAKQMAEQPLRMLTKKDVCTLLHVSPATVDKYRTSHLLIATKMGREFKFSHDEVQKFIKRTAGYELTTYKDMCELNSRLRQSGTFDI